MTEFGTGLVYPLGLFLAHEGQLCCRNIKARDVLIGALDHLSGMQIDRAPAVCIPSIDMLMEQSNELVKQAHVTEKEARSVFALAKNILRMIDRANGIQADEAEYP